MHARQDSRAPAAVLQAAGSPRLRTGGVTKETTRRARSTTAGCAAMTVLAAALILIATGLIVSMAVPAFFERPEPSGRERLGKQSGLTLHRLRLAAEDGRLTEAEIAHAAGGEWTAKRDQDAIRITVGYEPGPSCYLFKVPARPGPKTSVRRERLDHCPAFVDKSSTAGVSSSIHGTQPRSRQGGRDTSPSIPAQYGQRVEQ